MHKRRRFLIGVGSLCIACIAGCSSSATSTLVTVQNAKGEGPVDFSLENASDATINSAFIAATEAVKDAGHESNQPGSTAEAQVWGTDLLTHALIAGERIPLPIPKPGRWDLRVVDRDGRYQHIAGLKLGAGGRYVLRIGAGSWRVF